ARRPADERSLDALLAELETKSAELVGREREVAEREEEIRLVREERERTRSGLSAKAGELWRQAQEDERSGREQARQFLLQARRRVEEALGVARAAVNEATAKEARRLVEEGVQAENEAVKKLKAAAEKKGWTVKAGERGAGSSTLPRERIPSLRAGNSPSGERTAPRSPLPDLELSSEVDLRGLTGDEAEGALVRALDAAVLGDLPALRIIHGKGTGALRARVSEILRGDRHGGSDGSPGGGAKGRRRDSGPSGCGARSEGAAVFGGGGRGGVVRGALARWRGRRRGARVPPVPQPGCGRPPAARAGLRPERECIARRDAQLGPHGPGHVRGRVVGKARGRVVAAPVLGSVALPDSRPPRADR